MVESPQTFWVFTTGNSQIIHFCIKLPEFIACRGFLWIFKLSYYYETRIKRMPLHFTAKFTTYMYSHLLWEKLDRAIGKCLCISSKNEHFFTVFGISAIVLLGPSKRPTTKLLISAFRGNTHRLKAR